MGGKGSGKRKILSSNPTNDAENFATTSTTQRINSNRFSQLNPDQDLSDNESLISHSSKRRRVSTNNSDNRPKSAPKPPPINVQGKTIKEIREILVTENFLPDDFQTKFIPKGIRIITKNDEIFKKVKAKLENDNQKFFTHQLRSEQTTKIVLHGFYRVSEIELQEKLNELGFSPSKVKIMTVKRTRYDDHCVYLLHFPKSEKIKISNLRENVKSIDHVIVRWEYFKNKRKGPIQCSNCYAQGHGANSCFLDPVCVRCSENHKSKDCPHLIDPITKQKRDKIPDELLKCGLCGENHTATYEKCKKREEFIKRQEIYYNRTHRKNKPKNKPEEEKFEFKPAKQLENFQLPSTSRQATEIPAPQKTREPNRQANPNNLLSNDDCLNILRELQKLNSTAQTVDEQFEGLRVIANKYLNNGFTR